MNPTKNISPSAVTGYSPAKILTGKRWYIDWRSLNPDTGKLARKRVAIPHCRTVTERRKYATDMLNAINRNLSEGWNPFFELSDARLYTLFEDVSTSYCRYIYKLYEADLLREKTYNGYISFLSTFKGWISSNNILTYIYQLKQSVVADFLDWIWIDQGRSARTRDNYLMWLRTFTSFLLEKGYASSDPCATLTMIQGRRKAPKNRTTIAKDDMIRIKAFLETNNKHYLLACYILYYCFIRPKEMSFIRINDISLKNSTITVDAQNAKNRKTAIVTLPDCVAKLMIDLNVLTAPGDYYLFSADFMPGKNHRESKAFGDFWTLKMKKALNLPEEYKFYSLKDTGITDLIKDHADLLSVRDQARHSSLQITDLYTPLDGKEANEVIKKHESYF